MSAGCWLLVLACNSSISTSMFTRVGAAGGFGFAVHRHSQHLAGKRLKRTSCAVCNEELESRVCTTEAGALMRFEGRRSLCMEAHLTTGDMRPSWPCNAQWAPAVVMCKRVHAFMLCTWLLRSAYKCSWLLGCCWSCSGGW
ncbi:hypothetical protein COO60DRAFT_213071 [Scenedesmus sp. NREL 46B-D3]|nr:hypothetical protein COO60DRAFT_213071 [Scenedesmus sp. NREL 46B-D3]